MSICRVRPYASPRLCLSVNPLMESIKIGVYPTFNSDRALWKVRLDLTTITNYCHQDYGLKVHEHDGNVIGVQTGLITPGDIKCNFYMTEIANNIYTLQVARDMRKLLSYNSNNGLTLDHTDDSKLDMDSNLWIISKASDHLQQLPRRWMPAYTTC
jgi:hypothetical protein